jgi:predicted DNA-binding transcriptional regulator AlpA
MKAATDAPCDPLAVPSIAELLTHPERANDLPADIARGLLAQVAPLQMALLGRAFARDGAGGSRDRLLAVKDAAAKLGQSVEWLYKHASTLPFTVRNGRALRFSEVGIEAWIRRQQRR